MKVKRLKRAARVLTFFRYNFGYVPPYSLLLDGTFCQAALQNKINLREQMPKYLGESAVEMFVTECVLNELEQFGKPLHGAHVIAQQFRIAKCPHRPMRTAAECIAHLARRSKRTKKEEGENGEKNGGGKNAPAKYFVATQDDLLLEKLRELGGIPLMSIRFNTILLEKPSDQSQLEVERKNPTDELEKARQLKRIELGEMDGGKRHRKRKAKGPNPLSCKKKKKGPPPQMNSTTGNGATKGVAGAFGNHRKRKKNDDGDRIKSFLGEEKQNEESSENTKKKRRKRRQMLETENSLKNLIG